MARCIVPAADAMLDVVIPCLDKGFVIPIDYLGDDNRIEQAARVSYQKGTRTISDTKQLLFYLMENKHTSPFEQVSHVYMLKMPIFVARQLIRHRTAKVNEESARFSVLSREFYQPNIERLATQSKTDKQASSQVLSMEHGQRILDALVTDATQAFDSYDSYLNDYNLARELARIGLPLSTYTTMFWKIDLHNELHMIGLRDDAHAQPEIWPYAQAMSQFVKATNPIAWEAFEEFRKFGKNFSRTDWELIAQCIDAPKLQRLSAEKYSQSKLDRFWKKLGLNLKKG